MMFIARFVYNLFPEKYKPLSVNVYQKIISILNSIEFNLKIAIGKLIRIFYKPKFPDANEVGFNIHLGCGSINHPHFINVDGFPYRHIHYVHNIDKLPMFTGNCANLIYASHCLEHFPYRKIHKVLKEWRRILKEDGVLRLSVPDFDKLVNIYQSENEDPDTIIEQLMGGQNNKFNYHLSVFNKKNLSKILKESGFYEITEWTPGNSEKTTFNDFSSYTKTINNHSFEISLNLQAKKFNGNKI